MPYRLSDLDLEEVSLVGKAANKRRFLVFKSGAGRNDQTQTGLSKAAILDIVQKAVAPLAKENQNLKKELQKQRELLRKKSYVELSEKHLSEIVSPEVGAEILHSLEALPADARGKILKTLKQANAVKKEVSRFLYHPVGTDRPAPGSARAEFDALVEKRMSEIRKSGAGSDPKVLRALAVQQLTREKPELAKAVLAEERANYVKTFAGVM